MGSSYKQVIIVPFSKIDEIEKGQVGIKGANLGKLLSLRIPVPNGFIVTADTFNLHLAHNNLYEFIQKEISSIEPSDSVRIENASKRIRSSILKVGIAKEIQTVIEKAYAALSGFSDCYIAVRSSTPKESLKEGGTIQYATFLNVKGKDEVVRKVKECWASVFSPQNIFYLINQRTDISSISMAVVVQKMVQAEVSGVMFTLNPIDNDKSKVSIEAVLGLGEVLTDGQITPDSYLVNKESGEILEKHIVPQEWMLVRKGRTKKGEDPNVKVKISEVWKTKQKLENKYIEKLLRVGKVIEDYFGEPCEIEWAYEGGKIWIVQTRPVLTLKMEEESWKRTPTLAVLRSKVEAASTMSPKDAKGPSKREEILINTEDLSKRPSCVLLKGRGIGSGVVSGKVKIVAFPKQLGSFMEGVVLVTPSLTEDYKDKLGGVVGIITDEGGRNSHVEDIAKEAGVPCISDAQIATRILREDEVVTINANSGEVLSGASQEGLLYAEKLLQLRSRTEGQMAKKRVDVSKAKAVDKDSGVSNVKTATKVFVNISDLSMAPNVALMGADGVGVISGEELLKEAGVHPQLALRRRGGKDQIVSALTLGIFRVAKSFEPRPVIYKLSNLSSSEYRKLQGGEEFEVEEANPMIGLRGASRFSEYPDEVRLELEALRSVRNKENLRNVWLAIPFVRTYKELLEVKHEISAFGFKRSSTFKLFITAEVPSCVIRIGKLLEIGIDGVIMDTDLLAQLILAIDKSNPKIGEYYKDNHMSVLWAVENVIKACNKARVHSQILAHVNSFTQRNIKKFVKWGVSSISVSPDILSQTREFVAEAERELFSRRKR